MLLARGCLAAGPAIALASVRPPRATETESEGQKEYPMPKTQLRPTNDSYPNPPAEWDASVPSAAAADDAMLDLASLRNTLTRNQHLSLARPVRLGVYALAAAGWIAFFGHLVWIAVTKPTR